MSFLRPGFIVSLNKPTDPANPYAGYPVVPSALIPRIHEDATQVIQGGQALQHWHLNTAQYTTLTGWAATPSTIPLPIIHETAAQTIQGGSANQHWHLNTLQYNTLTGWAATPSTIPVTLPLIHEESTQIIQGGAAMEHYHLTEDEHTGILDLLLHPVSPTPYEPMLFNDGNWVLNSNNDITMSQDIHYVP